ncbi:MAG: hypothetical protein FVQ83_11365 [Chloroflexi bacterium]|nr:hypothetical protein [Chloroflexota bacterium]
MARTTWKKQLSVDLRIVRLLSASTYEDFPGAIREIVSNSYDADATEVDIMLDLENEVITISDNGNGMTPDDFDFFLRIAGQQRGRQISPVYNRKRIGRFGIGFLAIFPFAKTIQMISTARGSDIRIEANIPAEQFFKKNQVGFSIGDVSIPGTEISDPRYLSESGTTFHITGFSELCKQFFQHRDTLNNKAKPNSIVSYSPEKRLVWWIRENLPLEYPANSSYKKAFTSTDTSSISLTFNKEKIYRNTPGDNILENDVWNYNGFRCRYVIATDWKAISPVEERYLKIRLSNVGVGERTTFGLQLLGRTYSRLHWLSGDIHLLDGFDNLITIDRARFRETPEFDIFSEYFRSRLRKQAAYVENASVSSRDITRQLSNSRVAEVGSRQTIINSKIEDLKNLGFNLISKPVTEASVNTAPVKIDFRKKEIKVIEDHEAFRDFIQFGNDNIAVNYLDWELVNSESPAIRRGKNSVIEINTKYPLFKSKRYGEIFKKTLIILYLLSKDDQSKRDLFLQVSNKLIEEFGDIE